MGKGQVRVEGAIKRAREYMLYVIFCPCQNCQAVWGLTCILRDLFREGDRFSVLFI